MGHASPTTSKRYYGHYSPRSSSRSTAAARRSGRPCRHKSLLQKEGLATGAAVGRRSQVLLVVDVQVGLGSGLLLFGHGFFLAAPFFLGTGSTRPPDTPTPRDLCRPAGRLCYRTLERDDTGFDSDLTNSTQWNCSDGAMERAAGSRSQRLAAEIQLAGFLQRRQRIRRRRILVTDYPDAMTPRC